MKNIPLKARRRKAKSRTRELLVALLSLSLTGTIVVPGFGAPTCTLLPARSGVVSGNVFLGGDYIEIGLSPKGSWGTSADAPAGFRARQGSSRIGLVSDVDGFCATRTDNVDKPIDYFMPGTPEERWGVGFKIEGVSYYGSYSELENEVSSTGVTATHTVSNETSGDNLAAKVISTISLNGTQVLRVTATHSFTKTQAYFKTEVVITNLYGSALTDVRYHRSFDPDNAKDQGGNYTTRQTIVATHASSGESAVEAKLQDSDVSALSSAGILKDLFDGTPSITTELPILFYTRDAQAAVYFGGFANSNPFLPYSSTDPFTSPQALNDTTEADRAIGIILRTSTLASGSTSRRMNYITSLDRRSFADLSSELETEAGEPEIESESQPPVPVSVPPAPRLPRFDAFATGPVNATPGQDLVLTGSRLNCTSEVQINGSATTFSHSFLPSGLESLSIGIPSNLSPGRHRLAMDSCDGNVVYENLLRVPNPPVQFEIVTRNSLERMLALAKLNSFVLSNYSKGYDSVQCIVNASVKSLETAAKRLLSDACRTASMLLVGSVSSSEFRRTHLPANIWMRITLGNK